MPTLIKYKWEFPSGIPPCFFGTAELLPLGFLLEFPRGRLGTNSFWRPFGSILLFAIPRDSFSGIPPCFPLLSFTLIVLFARNSVFPVGGSLFFSFLGELHTSVVCSHGTSVVLSFVCSCPISAVLSRPNSVVRSHEASVVLSSVRSC